MRSMTTLLEIEAAIERLPDAERTELARWLQERVDLDAGLVVCDEVAAELDAARQELARGEAANWEQLKHSANQPGR